MGCNARRTHVWLTIGSIALLGLSAPEPSRGGETVGEAEPQTAATAERPAAEDARKPTPPLPLQPKIQDLGNGRYRIGLIEVDKVKRQIRIPGAVLREEPPLEFLAIVTGGFKEYESLIELGASAYEINLACILMGLDPDRGVAPQHHFDPKPVEGDPVDVWLEWKLEGETTRVDAADLIRLGEEKLPRGEWVYTGSATTPDGQYLAHLDGTVVGFVHDPSSIIEHRTGFGIGDFGAVMADRELLPPVGSFVTMIVAAREKNPPVATESGQESGQE
jgi:hypothetical protein